MPARASTFHLEFRYFEDANTRMNWHIDV
uniref:Uncharacterized protein n=1 Tax=Rhizophora mucronata TaxID=61149 RepID=A0A2P2NXU3_RHIMU